MNRINRSTVALAGLAAVSAQSFAVGVDLTALTAAVDLSTVIPAMILVGSLLMAPAIAKYAIRAVQKFFPK